MTALENLEAQHAECEAALDALKATWAREDETTAEIRARLLEAHAQGARDRDAVRVRLGGVSVMETPPVAEPPVVKSSRRASSIPATPLAALEQL